MKVAVVGAGIGGLCVAVGLQRNGADVTVFERSDRVRAGGSGLSIFGNGLRALESLGLKGQFEAITSPEAATYRSGNSGPTADGWPRSRLMQSPTYALCIAPICTTCYLPNCSLEPSDVRWR